MPISKIARQLSVRVTDVLVIVAAKGVVIL